MSDNIPPDVIDQELDARLRIPNEVWTDVMKLLPRHFLVKLIAPVCFRFKEISDKNVKNIHVITKANWFSYKLKMNDPIAKKQLEQLAANDCQLSGQFRLTKFRVIEENKAILRHCPDFFHGCRIAFYVKEKNKNSPLFLECLTQLEEAKPIEICIVQRANQVIDYWHHRTFQNCSRFYLAFWSGLSAAIMMNIFDWLHHQPNGVYCDSSADQQVRCMIVWRTGHNEIDWIINRCSENIQQAQDPADRRSFVLSFCCWNWPGFGQFRRIENKSTGEVLTLERKMLANGEATHRYRLRRCLTEEEANGAVLYAGMFRQGYGIDAFNIGDETPEVMII